METDFNLAPEDLLAIPVVAVVLSGILEYITRNQSPLASKFLTVALSVIVGGGYWFLRGTALWVPIVGILTISSTFYAFFLK